MSTDKEQFVDYYEMLGIESTATDQQIRIGYLKLAKNAHPDAGGSNEQMKDLNTAYKTLMNERSKMAYDKLYRLHNGLGDNLELREEDPGTSTNPSSTDGLEDAFVDQLYSEYYTEGIKKKNWIKKLFG